MSGKRIKKADIHEKVKTGPRLWPIVLIHFFEILYSLFILSWMYFSFFIPHYFRINILYLTGELFGESSLTVRVLSYTGICLICLIALFKLFGIFFKWKFPKLSDTSRMFTHGVNVAASILPLLYLTLYLALKVKSLAFFADVSFFNYAVFIVSLGYNFVFIILLIRNYNKKNSSFHEYLSFKRQMRDHDKNFLKLIVKMGIQKKLILSFIAIVLILISTLSYILLGEYRRSILSTIIYNGTTLAERSASVMRTNLGDNIATGEFFDIEARKNSESGFPFKAITFYIREPSSSTFKAGFSTDPDLLKTEIAPFHVEKIGTGYLYDRVLGVYDFISPVSLAGKLVGYLLVSYDESVIYSSYFNTQVRIIIFSFFFMYIAIVIIYIFGSQIVFPILFLRMSVNKLSSNLAQMISGELKVSANLLSYNDIVHTRDEIKTLSSEIKNMAGVIQGVVPYISASTFKNIDKGSSTSVKKSMTYLFTDIRGFTTMCEGMIPKDVVGVLNRYLDLQAGIILANNGDIDKFVGDEMMTMFDGPRKELNACKAAMEIRRAMAEEKEARLKAGEKTVEIGIGINTGEVVFGSVGAKERMDFTSIGDTVNLAARLESANKQYGTKTLISQAVYQKIKDQFVCRQIDLITVKGKQQLVRIFEILQEKSRAGKRVDEIRRIFEAGLAKYRKQEWDEALEIFTMASHEFDDEASRIFIDRIHLYKINPPPADWDGVFNLLVK